MKGRNDSITLAKKNIYHLYPKVIFIDISILRLADKNYESRITLKTKAKSFFVIKDHQNYKESLKKSCRAIKKQLEKEKVDRMNNFSVSEIFENEI